MDFEAMRVAMVDRQIRPSDISDPAIVEAMLSVPREPFVPRASRAVAYADAPVPLAEGRAMLEPRTLAKMLDALRIAPDALTLAVGPGHGYSAALLARLAAAVVAVEQEPAFCAQIRAQAAALGVDNLVVESGPLAAGAPNSGPYDAILLEGGVAVEPAALLDQLKDGGRLAAIWMDGPASWCRVWLRSGSVISTRRLFDAPAGLLPGFDSTPEFTF